MDISTPAPKPAPPKFIPPPVHKVEEITPANQVSALSQEIFYREGIPEERAELKPLPPINLKSPKGDRVLEVRDPVKAESMISKGWTVTTDKKTPYVPKPHLTDQPLRDNPALAAMKQEINKESHPPLTHRQKSAIRNSTKSNKEKK